MLLQTQADSTMSREEMDRWYPKRFSITKCLNNSRIFPTNILEPIAANQESCIEPTMLTKSLPVEEADDVRKMWHSGTAHAPVDRATFKQWVIHKHAD